MRGFYATFSPKANDPVLDIGGYLGSWDSPWQLEDSFPVTIINTDKRNPVDNERFTIMEGDATALPFADGCFRIAFSNSVIEHVGSWEQQTLFAREARRVADELWIQTPAKSFPIEPHFLGPFIHWFPKGLQRRLARHFTLWGWIYKPTPAAVDAKIASIRLLTLHEFQTLFPDCHIMHERFLGLTKSYIAIRREGCDEPV
jgi:hypothetical protein